VKQCEDACYVCPKIGDAPLEFKLSKRFFESVLCPVPVTWKELFKDSAAAVQLSITARELESQIDSVGPLDAYRRELMHPIQRKKVYPRPEKYLGCFKHTNHPAQHQGRHRHAEYPQDPAQEGLADGDDAPIPPPLFGEERRRRQPPEPRLERSAAAAGGAMSTEVDREASHVLLWKG